MASYSTIFLTVSAVCLYIIAVEADIPYEIVTEKPDDYPNFEDDPFVQRLAQSRFPSRVKRELVENHCGPEDDTRLCCAQIKKTTPYVIKHKGIKLNVVQAPKFFSQTIPEVTCRNGAENKGCFSDFRSVITANSLVSKCRTVTSTISLLVQENKAYKMKELTIGVDCACIIENDTAQSDVKN